MLFYRGDGFNHYEANTVNIRCPACRHQGAFHGFADVNDLSWTNKEAKAQGHGSIYYMAGIRQCPNLACRAVVAIFSDSDERNIIYPPEVIDFDATNLPSNVLASLEEAIKCHAAECYRASALLVRRTLEELCDDKGAIGRDLKTRIEALKTVAVIPDDLLIAADELRVLGNDAAHIKAKDYDSIGRIESELAIDLAKELLKSVYQYASLVDRLKALKKQTSISPP